jgi:hypothetical protein
MVKVPETTVWSTGPSFIIKSLEKDFSSLILLSTSSLSKGGVESDFTSFCSLGIPTLTLFSSEFE